jgi:hypothetical protein
MIVRDVMAELGEKLETIPGLRVYTYDVGKVAPPAALVGLPDDITFDATYGRGSDSLTIPVWVVVARVDALAATENLVEYLDGSGSKSVKAAVDSTTTNTYTECDTVTVVSAAVGAYTGGGVAMLGAEFTVTVTGSGS